MRDKEKLKEYMKIYREKNKDSIKEYNKEYKKKNKDSKKKSDKKYYEKNKKKLIEKSKNQNKKEIRKKWKDENKEKIKQYNKEYKLKNRDSIKESGKEYRKNNKEVINEKRRIRMKSDNLYRLSTNIRNSIKSSINRMGYTKNSKTFALLGCSFEEFKIHLESKFESWMCWENYGKYNGELNYGWDIDHIIPISSATTVICMNILNHYTNLQPLCSYINRNIKKDTIYNSPLEKPSY